MLFSSAAMHTARYCAIAAALVAVVFFDSAASVPIMNEFNIGMRAGYSTTHVNFNGGDIPDGRYESFLHSSPCSQNDGGQRYDPFVRRQKGNDQPTVQSAMMNSEVYASNAIFAVQANIKELLSEYKAGTEEDRKWKEYNHAVMCSNGDCSGSSVNQFEADPESLISGLSVVVYDDSNKKMLCADLERDDVGYYTGSLDVLTSYKSDGDGKKRRHAKALKGKASLFQPGVETTVEFRGRGFQDADHEAYLLGVSCVAMIDGNDCPSLPYRPAGQFCNPIFDQMIKPIRRGVGQNNPSQNAPTVTCTDGKCRGSATNSWAPTEAELKSGLSDPSSTFLDPYSEPRPFLPSGLSIAVLNNADPTNKNRDPSQYTMLCADLDLQTTPGTPYNDGSYYGGALKYQVQSGNQRRKDGVSLAPINLDDKKGSNWVSLTKPNVFRSSIQFDAPGFPDRVFDARLQSGTCASDGPAYNNAGPMGYPDATNENWPTVTCERGTCTGSAVNDWHPAPWATLSLVVYDSIDCPPECGTLGDWGVQDFIRRGQATIVSQLGPTKATFTKDPIEAFGNLIPRASIPKATEAKCTKCTFTKMMCADIGSDGKAGKFAYLKHLKSYNSGYGRIKKSDSGLMFDRRSLGLPAMAKGGKKDKDNGKGDKKKAKANGNNKGPARFVAGAVAGAGAGAHSPTGIFAGFIAVVIAVLVIDRSRSRRASGADENAGEMAPLTAEDGAVDTVMC